MSDWRNFLIHPVDKVTGVCPCGKHTDPYIVEMSAGSGLAAHPSKGISECQRVIELALGKQSVRK